jgi:hypothetical protein
VVLWGSEKGVSLDGWDPQFFLFTYGNEDKCPGLVDLDRNKRSNCNSDQTCNDADAS